MNYSLNFLKWGYIGDYIGDYYKGYLTPKVCKIIALNPEGGP